MILSVATAKSQGLTNALNDLKAKRIDSVIKKCALPFNLSAGSEIDNPNISDAGVLKRKFQTLFRKKYFDDFFKGKRTIDNSRMTISYEVRSFNDEGELESESSLIFHFKKAKDGSLRLYKIMLAG